MDECQWYVHWESDLNANPTDLWISCSAKRQEDDNKSMIPPINHPDQPNGRAGCNTADETYLNAALDAGHDIVASAPATDDASLDIPKCTQRDGHDADAPVQRHDDMVGKEVRHQRDEAANEVADGEGERRDPGLVTVGRGLAVVESDEEVEESRVRAVEGGVDLGDGLFGQSERGEDVMDNGAGFSR